MNAKSLYLGLGAITTLLGLMVFGRQAQAAQPRQLSIQGRMANASGTPLTAAMSSVKLSVWSDPVSIDLTHRCHNEEHASVPVRDGLFQVVLGGAPQGPISTNCEFTKAYWVEIQIGSDAPMRPRLALSSVVRAGAAAIADTAEALRSGSVVATVGAGSDGPIAIKNQVRVPLNVPDAFPDYGTPIDPHPRLNAQYLDGMTVDQLHSLVVSECPGTRELYRGAPGTRCLTFRRSSSCFAGCNWLYGNGSASICNCPTTAPLEGGELRVAPSSYTTP